jgi:hypothetical protein
LRDMGGFPLGREATVASGSGAARAQRGARVPHSRQRPDLPRSPLLNDACSRLAFPRMTAAHPPGLFNQLPNGPMKTCRPAIPRAYAFGNRFPAILKTPPMDAGGVGFEPTSELPR